jgi:S-formylglutathione hydrolase FrmB
MATAPFAADSEPEVRRAARNVIFQYEFQTAPGDHNWAQWNERLPSLFRSLGEHFPPSS